MSKYATHEETKERTDFSWNCILHFRLYQRLAFLWVTTWSGWVTSSRRTFCPLSSLANVSLLSTRTQTRAKSTRAPSELIWIHWSHDSENNVKISRGSLGHFVWVSCSPMEKVRIEHLLVSALPRIFSARRHLPFCSSFIFNYTSSTLWFCRAQTSTKAKWSEQFQHQARGQTKGWPHYLLNRGQMALISTLTLTLLSCLCLVLSDKKWLKWKHFSHFLFLSFL